MGERRLVRVPVFLIVIAALVIAATVGIYLQQAATSGPSAQTIQADLLNHNPNDDKDNCPNDGNAGKGNDNKGPNGGCREHPPRGQYGKGKGKP